MLLKFARRINLSGTLLGKIGPYFINAQFLYGSEEESNELLSFIDYELENTSKDLIPKNVFEKVLYQYENNEIYATIINALVSYLKGTINIDDIDYISGGERRDWFFSNMIAFLLKKPHITVYKDLTCVLSSYNFSQNEFVSDLDGKNDLHVADILNQGSSYLRAWIPAIKNLGANIKWSLVCLDRNQGGTEKIKDAGLIPLSLLNVDAELFEEALHLGIINENQLEMLKQFVKEPDNTMREFLINHPDFLENALNSDEKTAKRAKLCIENNFYGLK